MNFLLIFIILLKTAHSDMVPVLIYGKKLSNNFPALAGVGNEKFHQIIESEILNEENSIIIALVFPEFNFEDISQCKNRSDQCNYYIDNDLHKLTFIPYVEDPGNVLMRQELEFKTASFHSLPHKIEAGNKKFIINLNENQHPGKLITNLNEMLSNQHIDDKIIVIFTGHKSHEHKISYKKRSIDHLALASKYALIYAEKFIQRQGNSSEKISTISTIITKRDGYSLFVNLFPMNFTLKFIKQGNSWSLSSAFDAESGVRYKIPGYLSALESYSYRCASNLTFTARNSIIKIQNTQILISFLQEHPKFDLNKIVYCDEFVTSGILTGLFVTAILLGALIFGIMVMANIKIYDEFDHHPLVIKAE
uniref:CSON011739 protein n=1 Tax=Culicoides sonorensis TaxID=179676 RepID=A0A336M3U5_CULSO